MERCDIEAVSALADGELPEVSAVRLREHLEECPSCRALAGDLAALKDGFGALNAEPPDTLAPGILYKIGLGEDPPRSRRIVKSLIGVAACLIAALVISRTVAGPRTDLYLTGGSADNAAPEAAQIYTDAGGKNMQKSSEESGGGAYDAPAGEPDGWAADREDMLNAAPPPLIGAEKSFSTGEFDYAAFTDLLRGNGMDYAETGAAGLLTGEGKVLEIGDAQLSVYEYLSNEQMESDAGCVSPDGFSIHAPDESSATYISWVSHPHFFKKDLLIVLYVGENGEMVGFLREHFGAPFAGVG